LIFAGDVVATYATLAHITSVLAAVTTFSLARSDRGAATWPRLRGTAAGVVPPPPGRSASGANYDAPSVLHLSWLTRRHRRA